ncbi:type II secretion system F family protein [Kitasatospora sp. RB6PN24]|uniref:type II secretion system F family protein n=1 Tax=Kitasatospora humi TaxID=2893891 RepID=UPI001E4E60C6|nr:type II secretion system F family protein [Kitasatospora humi]MCC9309955.1 type II secretion system F family protein [Kitasatospora humi]
MSDLLTSPDLLLALIAGLAAGGGIALLIASIIGWPRKVRTRSGTGQRLAAFARKRGAAAAITALVVLALTRWPVAAIGTGLLVLFWSKLFGGKKEETAALERVEALAAWTESLRDTVSAAVGLEQAVQASARAAAPALRPHLLTLIDRLRAKTPLPQALELLADDLADGDADVVITALKDNARLRGPGLSGVLGELARTARENADVRRRVLAQRSGTRRSVQIVVTVCVAFPVGMAVFNPGYVEPYRSLQGQGVLVLVAAFFLAGLAWLRRLSTMAAPTRLLTRGEARG